ncbi:hypothetical protein [Deefgea rivuli]|uniref:hypothetical protein n=1 Tax=Deefgea rivuli TaxID=400948 RepID=UPI00047FC6FC|nr:hypothetical protein [Deefgea rivuli]
MKYTLIAAIGLSIGSAFAATPVKISGTWQQQQVIEAINTDVSGDWSIRHGEEILSVTAAPAPFRTVKTGDWLNLEIRHHPAGMMRKLTWSTGAESTPYLILGQNMAIVGEVIPGWRWDQDLSLVHQQKRIKLKPGQARTIQGWCVLVRDLRPAQADQEGIANESETRADWWAQPKPCTKK